MQALQVLLGREVLLLGCTASLILQGSEEYTQTVNLHSLRIQKHLQQTAAELLQHSKHHVGGVDASVLSDVVRHLAGVQYLYGLGIFFTTLENEAGGAAKKEDFSPQKNLKGLHIRFLPDQMAETNISSREFIKKAEFVNAEAFAGSLVDDEASNGSGSGSSSSQSGNSGGGSTRVDDDNSGMDQN